MNPLWCPSIDDEMRDQMKKVVRHFPTMDATLFEGGGGGLGAFPTTSKLYIMAHGHSKMPVFSCNKKVWTASQLVALLKADGLSTKWRDIELLVCHAGESVNSQAVGGKLLGIRQQVDVVGKVTPKLQTAWDATAKKGQAPGAFTSADQLLPLAAQFAQALKSGGFSTFRVISYAAPVAQNFSGGKVTLDLRPSGGEWGEPLDAHRDLVKIWL